MSEPLGVLIIQTLAMPASTNTNGDIFGGWIVSQMDLAASVMAKKISKGRAATVAINSMSFIKPVQVGNLVSCFVRLISCGNTSMTIGVEVWTETLTSPTALDRAKVTEGVFVFVAIDEDGRPRQVPKSS